MTIRNQLLGTFLASSVAAIALGVYISDPTAQASNFNANRDTTSQTAQPSIEKAQSANNQTEAKPTKTEAAIITKIAWQPDFVTAQRVSKTSDKPLMIVFGAEWCGACKMLEKNTLSNVSVVEAAQNWVAVEIDVDKEPELAARYGIKSLPTTVFFKGDSKKFGFVGAAGPEDMLNVMQTARAKLQGAPASQS